MAKQTITKRLTPSVVADAQSLIAAGRHVAGLEWREPRTGFSLRFLVDAARYLYRGKHGTVTLPLLGEVPLDVARHLAEQCKLAIRDERDAREYVRTFLERRLAGDLQSAAHVAATHASARTAGVAYDADRPWRVSRLIERFVETKASELKKGRWARQYGRYFDDPAFDMIRDKRVPDVSAADLFMLKRTLVPAGAKANSRAFRIINQTVDMMNWAQQEEPINTGLMGADPVWQALSVKYKAKKRTRAPGPRELARMFLAVERHAALDDGAVIASPSLRALLLFTFVTAQRDGASAGLRRANILPHPDPERTDWRVAHFSEAELKGRPDETLAHAIPIPPLLARRLEALWAEVDPRDENAFAFPSRRKNGHIAANGLNALFRRLRGRAGDERPALRPDRPGKPGPKPRAPRREPGLDLFELYLRDLRPDPAQETYFVLHDARRSLTNFLVNQGLGRASSAILAHRMDPIDFGERDEESLRERMSRTTSRHYSTAQQVELKTKGMALWAQAFESALEEERRRIPPSVSDIGNHGISK